LTGFNQITPYRLNKRCSGRAGLTGLTGLLVFPLKQPNYIKIDLISENSEIFNK